jgi:hypothetical protein
MGEYGCQIFGQMDIGELAGPCGEKTWILHALHIRGGGLRRIFDRRSGVCVFVFVTRYLHGEEDLVVIWASVSEYQALKGYVIC